MSQVGDVSVSYGDGEVELYEGLSYDVFEEEVEQYGRKQAALAESPLWLCKSLQFHGWLLPRSASRLTMALVLDLLLLCQAGWDQACAQSGRAPDSTLSTCPRQQTCKHTYTPTYIYTHTHTHTLIHPHVHTYGLNKV